MKPKDGQLNMDAAYANDNVPDWWDSEPTHQELIAEEVNRARHEQHSASTADNDKWVQDAIKKGSKPF